MPKFFNIIPGIQSTEQNQAARSAAFMGVQDFSSEFDDLTNPTLGLWALTGPGPIAVDLTHGPGVWAVPNSIGTFMGKTTPVVGNGALTPWHVAARIRLPSVFAANDLFGIMLAENAALNNFVRVGTHFASNATRFIFEVCKGGVVVSALSNVLVETARFHDLELWYDGTTVWGSVDDVEVVNVTGTANVPKTQLSPFHGIVTTNYVAGQAALIDWVYAAAQRTVG